MQVSGQAQQGAYQLNNRPGREFFVSSLNCSKFGTHSAQPMRLPLPWDLSSVPVPFQAPEKILHGSHACASASSAVYFRSSDEGLPGRKSFPCHSSQKTTSVRYDMLTPATLFHSMACRMASLPARARDANDRFLLQDNKTIRVVMKA